MTKKRRSMVATAASWADIDFVKMAMEVAAERPDIAAYMDMLRGSRFRPRPDDLDAPGCPDQQESFCNSQDRVSFLIGGNGAGTSVAAAYKAARFMLQQQPPPRKNTPFWVLSNTFENTCNVCWGEKLYGMGFIPECEVDRIVYHNAARNQPKAVILKPWPTEKGGDPKKNWVIEFKTFEQGKQAMMGASLGGFWISETPPANLCAEIIRGLRDYAYRGACMIEFTPIDPWLSMEMEEAIDRKPPSWKVYRANTMSNLPNLPGGQEWVDSMLAFTPEELWPTRLYGDFAVFEHQIFSSFREDTHVVDVDCDEGRELDRRMLDDRELIHAMGTDWGWSSEHAQAQVWAAWDPAEGSWYIYDEYWTVSQDKILLDHVDETLSRCESWNWPIVRDTRGRRRIELERMEGRYRPNHADSAGKPHIQEYNLRGIPTATYQKTPGSVVNGIMYMKFLLMPQQDTGRPLLRVASRCKNLINEFRMYRWKRGQTNMQALNPGLAKPEPVPKFDHCIDAARYMIMGERRYEGWDESSAMKKQRSQAERTARELVHVDRQGYNGRGSRGLVRFQR